MKLKVNGAIREVAATADRPLLGILRDELDLTGSKYGCGEGECGACTVLIDGKAMRSCRLKAGGLEGKEIITIEGLTTKDRLHPVQQAFLEADAMQCGYCTCGMIVSAVALLRKQPNPTRPQVIEGMNGNICRCGAYQRIIDAVLKAAKSPGLAAEKGSS
jgi:aerobic-type carbon monoxide dehydrogenase small subunit (CoxS/CutS family)